MAKHGCGRMSMVAMGVVVVVVVVVVIHEEGPQS